MTQTIDNSQVFYFDSEISETDAEFLELVQYLNGNIDENGIKKIVKIFSLLPKPITIVLEEHYVDKVFRDSFYRFFSSKHFDTKRDCKRLSFFQGEIFLADFYTREGHRKLNSSFIGFSVLKPISPGCVGRTYLNPTKLLINRGYIRTTKFNVVVLGAKLEVEAFPFSTQDSETMTCAETTIWNMLEYFGTRYPDYKIIYPSDIMECLSKYSHERILPSKGLIYGQISGLMKDFGFSPRIYFKDTYPETFEKIYHYYVESGLPIIVGIKGFHNGNRIAHALVCIGHSDKVNNIECKEPSELYYIDSADFYKEYVVIDDNQIPYSIQPYNGMSTFKEPQVKGIVVPLYKRIFLEAGDASAIAYGLLLHEFYGIKKPLLEYNGEEKYSKDNPLIVRIFLTSSRAFKQYRAINYGSARMAYEYTHLPLPKFIWVAELSLKNLYFQNKVFGEIIIDATASRHTRDSLIAVHYPGYFGYRLPHEPVSKIYDMLKFSAEDMSTAYPLYKSNLFSGGNLE